MPKKSNVTLAQLKKALTSKNAAVRYNAMCDFSHSEVTPEAIPILLAALKDKVTRNYAADSLGRLGSAALSYGRPVLDCPQVIWELKQAAYKIDEINCVPHAYTHCLAAMIKIDPKNEFIVELVHDHIGISGWFFARASFEALKTIGTPEALDLLARSVTFWMPELDKKEKRIVQEIVDGKR